MLHLFCLTQEVSLLVFLAMGDKIRHTIKALKKGLLSLFSYIKIKSTAIGTARSTIENKADLETTKYATKDFAEKLIRDKEDAINVSLSGIEGKLKDRTIKLFGEFDEKVKGAINVLRSDVEGKLEERTIKLFDGFDEKVKSAIDVLRSDVEGKIEENTIKLFNEFEEKTKTDRDDILSSLQDDYRKQAGDTLSILREESRKQTDDMLFSLRGDYEKQTDDLLETIKSTSLVKRLNIYVLGICSVFVIIIILLSLFS